MAPSEWCATDCELEAERQHVGEQPGLDDLVRIDAGLLAMIEAAVEDAGDPAQGLQEHATLRS